MLAYQNTQTGQGTITSLLAAKNFSGVTVPGALNGGSTVVFGAADQTTSEPITYNNVPSGFGTPTTNADYVMGTNGFFIKNGATTGYPALPAGAMESGDHYLFVATSASGVSTTYEEVINYTTSTSGGPLTIDFPAGWTYTGPAAVTWPSFDLSYAGYSGNKGVCRTVGMSWTPNPANAGYEVNVTATANYLNGSTTLAIPNLSGLTGFLPPPASKSPVDWSAGIYEGNFLCLGTWPTTGSTTEVANSGNYTAP